MYRKALYTIVLSMIYLTCTAQHIKIADSLRIKYGIPELAFAVISADKVVEEQYLGYHKLGQSAKSDTARKTDYFHLGSNTKAITGFIAAYLVEQNKIKWSTKLFDIFPEWKKQANPTYYQVTLQDLLSHRATIQPYTSGGEYQKLPSFKGDKAQKRQEFAAYLIAQIPVNSNKIYNYSNAGYSIATAMLEKVSGNTWEVLVEKIINSKLHLKAKFGWPNKLSVNEPWGHWIENNKLTPVQGNTSYNLNLAEPAGDICMTLPDYIKFIKLNLQGIAGNGNILKSSTYNFLHYGLKEYAIGWGNKVEKDIKLSEHAGSAGTYFCYTLINGIKNKAYVIVTNSATENAQKGVFELLKILQNN